MRISSTAGVQVAERSSLLSDDLGYDVETGARIRRQHEQGIGAVGFGCRIHAPGKRLRVRVRHRLDAIERRVRQVPNQVEHARELVSVGDEGQRS